MIDTMTSPKKFQERSSMLELSLVILILTLVMPIILTISLSLARSTLTLSKHLNQKTTALNVLQFIKTRLQSEAVKIYPECSRTASNSLKFINKEGNIEEFLYIPQSKQVLYLSQKTQNLLPQGFEISQMSFTCASSLDDYFAKKIETVSFTFTLTHKSQAIKLAPVTFTSALKLRSH